MSKKYKSSDYTFFPYLWKYSYPIFKLLIEKDEVYFIFLNDLQYIEFSYKNNFKSIGTTIEFAKLRNKFNPLEVDLSFRDNRFYSFTINSSNEIKTYKIDFENPLCQRSCRLN